jgi:hypothetical protein
MSIAASKKLDADKQGYECEYRFHNILFYSLMFLMCLAGMPPTTVFAGTSLDTTAPAATTAFSPIVTPL